MCDWSLLGYVHRAKSWANCSDILPGQGKHKLSIHLQGNYVHPGSKSALEDTSEMHFFLMFSELRFSSGFGTLPLVTTFMEEDKEGRWKTWVTSCRSVHAATWEVGDTRPLAFGGARRWHKLMLSPNGRSCCRSLGNIQAEFWPQEEAMCSPPPFRLLFSDGGIKIPIEEYHESCQSGCCAVLWEVCFKMFNVS